jgi:3-hexulose-6-phosphate synthase
MKLQVSLDLPQLEKALAYAVEIQNSVDIIEVGSLLIYKYGEQAIRQFREALPQTLILADMKIADRGKEASKIAFLAGADWVTVVAGTSKNVIHTVCSTAHDMGKKVMLDLIDASSLGQSALEAQTLGVDALLFHKPSDEQTQLLTFDQWDIVKGNTKLPVFVAAPITRNSIKTLLDLNPDGIIISKSTEKDLPVEDILYFSKMIRHSD